MSCNCYQVEFQRIPAESVFAFQMERKEAETTFTFSIERTCEPVENFVPFSAADGHFFTEEGYTIIVKL